jgi:hypothetical protein
MTTMPPIAAVKAGMRATWTTGDFGQIAHYEVGSGEALLERLGVAPEERVLDIAVAPAMSRSLPLHWARL